MAITLTRRPATAGHLTVLGLSFHRPFLVQRRPPSSGDGLKSSRESPLCGRSHRARRNTLPEQGALRITAAVLQVLSVGLSAHPRRRFRQHRTAMAFSPRAVLRTGWCRWIRCGTARLGASGEGLLFAKRPLCEMPLANGRLRVKRTRARHVLGRFPSIRSS